MFRAASETSSKRLPTAHMPFAGPAIRKALAERRKLVWAPRLDRRPVPKEPLLQPRDARSAMAISGGLAESKMG